MQALLLAILAGVAIAIAVLVALVPLTGAWPIPRSSVGIVIGVCVVAAILVAKTFRPSHVGPFNG